MCCSPLGCCWTPGVSAVSAHSIQEAITKMAEVVRSAGSPSGAEPMTGWDPGTAALHRSLPGGLESPEIPNLGTWFSSLSPAAARMQAVGSGSGEC